MFFSAVLSLRRGLGWVACWMARLGAVPGWLACWRGEEARCSRASWAALGGWLFFRYLEISRAFGLLRRIPQIPWPGGACMGAGF